MIISAFKILFFTDKKSGNPAIDRIENMFHSKYNVKTVITGSIQEAMQQIENCCIHLMIADTVENITKLQSLLKKCKNSVFGSHIYCIYLTDSTQEDFVVSMYKMGVSEVINIHTPDAITQARLTKLAEHIIKCTNAQHKEELLLDPLMLTVSKGNELLEFTKKEFEILQLLSNHPNKTFSRTEIYLKVWGTGIIVSDRTLDVHISKIRSKIGEQFIQTYKGVGYRFVPR